MSKVSNTYTTGAYIERIQINGVWRWAVVQFEDDTFHLGECVNVHEDSTTEDGLMEEFED